MATYLVKSPGDLPLIARTFLDTVSTVRKVATVVALQGELGAGKTAFTQAVGEILGIKEDMHSPTFVIEKVYPIDWRGFNKFIHIDAYRLEKDTELMHLGWEELVIQPDNLIFIEWPERVGGIIPGNALKILFEHIDEKTRQVTFDEKIR